MRFRCLSGLLFSLLLFPITVLAKTTVLHNVQGAHIVDRDGPAPQVKKFSAIAFSDGKVLALGSGEALRARFKDAEVIDGQGRGLIPGLIDAHGHVAGLGALQNEINLRGLSLADSLQTVKAFAAKHPQHKWITGRGWNQVIWDGKQWPGAADLDALKIERPIWLRRVDGHAGWANSAALRAAGIGRNTRAPEGGEILHDAGGEPTGILIDNAMTLMEKAIPAPTQKDVEAALSAAFKLALSRGLTSVHDAGIDGMTYRAYRALVQRDAIPIRVYPMLMAGTAEFDAMLKKGIVGTPESHLYIRSIKIAADGALGSRGAAMLAPYHDQSGHKGLLLHSDAELDSFFSSALEQGFQINVHAIGDRANHKILDEFAKYTAPKEDTRALRHRIEHAQIVMPEDIPRFNELGIVASMQPIHATSDMNMAEDRIGRERLKGAYAWRTFLNQGTPLAAGSDFPVEPANPFFGLHAAVTRQSRSGEPEGGWLPQQKITLAEALRSFTLDAAYAAHQEQVIGSLEPGKAADFVLLDRDIFAAAPAELWRTGVLETWVDGERVYAR